MRQRVLAVVMSVALTASGAAQLPGVTQSRVFLANVDPLHPVWRESIRNSGTSSIVAFHAKFRCSRHSELNMIHDPLVNFGTDFDVGMGKSAEIAAADPQRCSGGVDAVVFSDGHHEGDRDQVRAIYARRKGVAEELRSLKKLLDEGAAGRLNTKQILTRAEMPLVFHTNTYVDSLGLSEPPDPAEDAEIDGRSAAHAAVTMMLKTQAIWGVPSEYTAQRKPRVEQVMRERGEGREQAYLVITAMKVQEWLDALQGNLKAGKSH
jgi:hypothetical protein